MTQPAWQRVTVGEPRWPALLAVLVAIALQLAVPERLTVIQPYWLLPAVEGALLLALGVGNPSRINVEETWLRYAGLALVAVASVANAFSAGRLVYGLVTGTEGQSATQLLGVGGAVWMTNVLVFALWYWEFDRGGPAARANARKDTVDFQFPQMQNPEPRTMEWEPIFVDYLYLSFTNAAAFSPTDTMPLSRWAKLAMMGQSMVSLATGALIIARAVNILK